MKNTENTLQQHLIEIQSKINEIRNKLQNNPFQELQTQLNELRELAAGEQSMQTRNKEILLEKIENAQAVLDGSFLFSLEEIQRELHNNYLPYKRRRYRSSRMAEMIREFFNEL